jgi:cellulose synthase/poly-beta-1,6-N-acetylglucosamine synthase-like glycosyltransferase
MVIVDQKRRISICMPTFNGSRYLRIAIESALSQTYTNIELLIVDDASLMTPCVLLKSLRVRTYA